MDLTEKEQLERKIDNLDISSYRKYSVNLGWIDRIQTVLVPCVKLARQLENYLEASVRQCQHIYSVVKVMPGVYDHMGESEEQAARCLFS